MPTERPNILLITSDQQHWHTMSCLGAEVRTPNLDRLAARGTVFQRAYCPNPTCTPTRASIITGQYPSQHGAWSLGTKLPESAHTAGEDFIDAGYRTALVGKAHFQQTQEHEDYPSLESYTYLQDLDFWRNYTEPFYGFEHIELARNHADEQLVGQHYAIWMEENGLANWRDYFRPPTGTASDQYLSWPLPERYHYNTWIGERSSALLEQYTADANPFFLWASFPDPHPPYLVSEPWATMYDPAQITVPEGQPGEHDRNPIHFQMSQQKSPDFSAWQETGGHTIHGFSSHLCDRDTLAREIAVYYGMISMMDKYIGQILDTLDGTGQADNTLVVFTSDHGHFYGHHGLSAKGPFHYEDVIRVPFIVRHPGQVPAGAKCHALQSLVDLAPTFLSTCGIDIPRTMTGVDQTAVWREETDHARDHIIVENHHQPTTVHVKTYVSDRYKVTTYFNQDYGELFDLEEDPGEFNNLWDDPTAQDLKARLILKLLHAEMGKEPLWMPRVSGA